MVGGGKLRNVSGRPRRGCAGGSGSAGTVSWSISRAVRWGSGCGGRAAGAAVCSGGHCPWRRPVMTVR